VANAGATSLCRSRLAKQRRDDDEEGEDQQQREREHAREDERAPGLQHDDAHGRRDERGDGRRGDHGSGRRVGEFSHGRRTLPGSLNVPDGKEGGARGFWRPLADPYRRANMRRIHFCDPNGDVRLGELTDDRIDAFPNHGGRLAGAESFDPAPVDVLVPVLVGAAVLVAYAVTVGRP